jgi:serine/threonine protein kinase
VTGIVGDHRLGAGVAQELQPGDPRKVGRYWLLGLLGSGGMGRVFLGRSPGGRLVAVKVIRAELAEQPEFRNRFVREVAAARTVSGVFTAAVVDADVDAPVPWLATAYVPGLSLADTITRHGPLPAASVLALAAGLAEGLGAIHAAGIVHRDLKPSNVLLAEDGPRIIDFGISRAAEATVLTGTGVVFGSPSFMSPEQARGQPVGPPSDVFSLGTVLSFAASGKGPFGTGSSATLLYRVVFTPPDTSGLPAALRALIEPCLAKDPEQRPTTEQLLAGLDTAPPTAGWLPASITQTFPSQPWPAPGPAAPTAVPDLPSMPAPQPAWVPRARVPESGEPTLRLKTARPLAAAGTQVPGSNRERERPRRSHLGLASAAAVVALLIAYLVVAMTAQLPPFGKAALAPSSPAPATTVPASSGPQPSPTVTSQVTSPATFPVTSPPTSSVTSPPTSPVTSPPTSPVTSPPTSPVTSPPTSPVTSPPTSPVTSPPTSPVTSPPTAPVTAPATSSAVLRRHPARAAHVARGAS